jgi:hypothetical protein
MIVRTPPFADEPKVNAAGGVIVTTALAHQAQTKTSFATVVVTDGAVQVVPEPVWSWNTSTVVFVGM